MQDRLHQHDQTERSLARIHWPLAMSRIQLSQQGELVATHQQLQLQEWAAGHPSCPAADPKCHGCGDGVIHLRHPPKRATAHGLRIGSHRVRLPNHRQEQGGHCSVKVL